MTQDEAAGLKQNIERTHPELRCDLQQYEGVWMVVVTNSRTNESFGIVNQATWQDRLNTMEGWEPNRS
jgi:hypothetical protein